ncbi:MAG: hypothetical protein ACRDY7_17260 [Acidimicrobiia bacterium]
MRPGQDAKLATLSVPGDFYWVRLRPTPLAGMPAPGANFPWAAAAEAGFRNVVSLQEHRPRYSSCPLAGHWLPLEDLFGKPAPDNPDADAQQVERAVSLVGQLLHAGGVIVHCTGGRGRTGTVLGGSLVRQGISPSDATAWLDRLHRRFS